MTDFAIKTDRLFVPLASDPHSWFLSGRKNWELRRLGRQYTERHVRPGRMVELRRGYSDKATSLWGVIDDVAVANTISSFFDAVPYAQVIPTAQSRDDAEAIAAQILGVAADSPVDVIGFQVRLIDATGAKAS
jgi:hypothetical protein